MSLVYVHESILETDADGIVNPVNCVGVMGKGLAKAMAYRWKHVEQPYKDACSNGRLRPGRVISITVGPRWEPFFWDSNDRWGNASTPAMWDSIERSPRPWPDRARDLGRQEPPACAGGVARVRLLR